MKLSVRSYADVGQYYSLLLVMSKHSNCVFNFSEGDVRIFFTDKKEFIEDEIAMSSIKTTIRKVGWDNFVLFFKRHSRPFYFGREKVYGSKFVLNLDKSISVKITDEVLFKKLMNSFGQIKKKFNNQVGKEFTKTLERFESVFGNIENVGNCDQKESKKNIRKLLPEKKRKEIMLRYGFDPQMVLEAISGPMGFLVVNMGICQKSLYLRSLRLFSENDKLRADNEILLEEVKDLEYAMEDNYSDLKKEFYILDEMFKSLTAENANLVKEFGNLELIISKELKKNKKDKDVEVLKKRLEKAEAKLKSSEKILKEYRANSIKRSRDDEKERKKIIKKIVKYNERLEDFEKYIQYSHKEKEKVKSEKMYLLPTGDEKLDLISEIFFWRSDGSPFK